MFLELALHLVLKKCQILASTKEAQPSLPLLGPLGSSAKARWSVMGLRLSGFLPTLQHVCLKKLQILPGIQSDLKHLRFPELIRPAMQGGERDGTGRRQFSVCCRNERLHLDILLGPSRITTTSLLGLNNTFCRCDAGPLRQALSAFHLSARVPGPQTPWRPIKACSTAEEMNMSKPSTLSPTTSSAAELECCQRLSYFNCSGHVLNFSLPNFSRKLLVHAGSAGHTSRVISATPEHCRV